MRFSNSIPLPEYLENALAPFYWSSVFSEKLRTDILSCILCEPSCREEVTKDFLSSFTKLGFLSEAWKLNVHLALTRFSKEGFQKST
jgi:hypothetical protein